MATAWCLPGEFVVPTDTDALSVMPSSGAVEVWEAQHADAAFGGTVTAAGLASIGNRSFSHVGYMYNQMLEFNPGDKEMSMRLRALNTTGAVYNISLFPLTLAHSPPIRLSSLSLPLHTRPLSVALPLPFPLPFTISVLLFVLSPCFAY